MSLLSWFKSTPQRTTVYWVHFPDGTRMTVSGGLEDASADFDRVRLLAAAYWAALYDTCGPVPDSIISTRSSQLGLPQWTVIKAYPPSP